jgi:hypothetical protein
MAKTCPNCGYHPIGPFTDNCPMCAEPVRNVRGYRGGGGGGGFGALSTPLKYIIAGTLIGLLGVGACCGVGIWRMGDAMQDWQKQALQAQAQAEAERRARTVAVSAADLLMEYENDPAAADEKYVGKYLEITGIVERTGQGRFETPFVILQGDDENAKIKIECYFDLFYEQDQNQIKRLRKGQTITVAGEYDGRVSNVQLRECVLVKLTAPAEGPMPKDQ